MIWMITIVAFSLAITAVSIVELRQSTKGNVLRLPDQCFVVITFAAALIYALAQLAAKIWL